METWVGISVPPHTPPQIVNRLAALIEQAMKNPELQKQLAERGVTPVYEVPAGHQRPNGPGDRNFFPTGQARQDFNGLNTH